MEEKALNILFICTANICRTPMAKYYLENLVKKEKLQEHIKVDSAGTSAFHRSPAAEYTRVVCAENHLDASGHTSQAVNADLLNKADLVLCMALHHREALQRQFPRHQNKIFTLKEYARHETGNPFSPTIEDPYGQELSAYRATFRNITREVERVWPELLKRAEEKTQFSSKMGEQ